MKKIYVAFALLFALFTLLFILIVVLSFLGVLSDESASHSLLEVSDGLMEYRSDVHGGYSFCFNSTLVFNEESSFDSTLATALVFEGPSSGGLLLFGAFPSFISQGGWMEGACGREQMAAHLRSQQGLNVTEVKSVAQKEFQNVKSCIADATAVENGSEVPLTVSFAECNGKLPIYAVASGPNSLSDVELLLGSFSC